MDVKCEKCSTEYEFDDAKVTEAGITVKCTNCGHLFRVVRQKEGLGPQSTTPGGSLPKERSQPPARQQWMIRNAEGDVREFKDLATLQQWIVERKVSRHDQISKTGENWKALGSIIELSSFFQAVDRQTPSSPPPPLLPSDRAPPPPTGRLDMMSTGEFKLEGPGHEATLVEARLEPVGSPPPVSMPTMTTPAPSPGPMYQSPPLLSQETPMYIDPGTPQYADQRGGGLTRGILLGVLVTVAIAGAAYFVFDQVQRREHPVARGGEKPAPVATSKAELVVKLERADVAAGRDTAQGHEEAAKLYGEILAGLGDPPSDPKLAARAEVGQARVATARAEYAQLEGRKAEADLGLAEMALARAKLIDSEDPALLVAQADYYRVRGDENAATRYAARAEVAKASAPELELVRAAAGLHSGMEAKGVARRLTEMSEAGRSVPRAQYLQAVAHERAGEKEQAIAALMALISANPDHEPAKRLLAKLGAKQVVAAPKEAPAPEQPAEKPAEQPKPAPVKPAEPPKPSPAKRAAAAKPSDGGNWGYDGLMTRGYKLLERGSPAQARRLFEAALKQRPGHPEPWANLGWCDLDQGKPADAIAHFQGSLRRQPRYADAMYGLGAAYEKAGNTQKALAAYQAYLQAHPRGSKARMVQRKLDRLR